MHGGILDKRTSDVVIRMAWEDRTTFEEIEKRFGLAERDVIQLMRREMKPSSFRMWRRRVSGRKTKHQKLMREERARRKKSSSYRDIITQLGIH